MMIVTVHGTFKVVAVDNEEIYLDPYFQGGSTVVDNGNNLQLNEIDESGRLKDFDGFQLGDYFTFNGEFEEIGHSKLFSKIKVFNTIISVPTMKVVRV